MSADPSRVREVIVTVLEAVKKPVPDELPDDLVLYGGGLELDSLEAAELSAALEEEFGSDPFSVAMNAGDDMPETIGDVVAFYGVPA